MADVNTSILTALEAGYHPQEIMDHIKNSEDPSHQEWYSNYSANMADRAKEPSVGSIYYNDGNGVVAKEDKTAKPSSVSTPLLDFAKNLTPAELAAAGLTTIAAIKGPNLYNAYQDRKIEKEKLSIEQRRLNAYEQQVTKQGMTPEPVTTVAGQPQGDKLSPLEEARIATERAKAEHIQSKIAIAERAATLKEEQAKARANKQPTTGAVTSPTGPTPTNPTVDLNTKINNKPSNFNLVEESEQNKLKNETANAKKQGVNPFAGATELKTGTGKPAFEGVNPEGKIKSSYPDIKSVPKGYAFIPDARYIDVLRNDLGQAEYTKNLTGRPYPTEYKGSPASAVEVGKEINRSLGRETRAELLARGIPESQLPKPTPGILEKTNAKGSKTVTVGGIVGAIAALPNLVHAAQGAGEKDVQKSYGSLVQGVGQFLGPLGAIGSELFGISPEELDTLRKAEKSRKQPVPPPR